MAPTQSLPIEQTTLAPDSFLAKGSDFVFLVVADAAGKPTPQTYLVTRDFLLGKAGIPKEIFNPVPPPQSGLTGVDGQCYTENPTIYAYNRYQWFDASESWELQYKGIQAGSLGQVYATLRLSLSSITIGDSVSLIGTATSPNGPINSVAFYNGSTLLNTLQTDPYVVTFTPTQTGRYVLTIKATDVAGITTTSGAQYLDVVAAGATPALKVTLTVPLTGNVVGQAVPVAATVDGGTGPYTVQLSTGSTPFATLTGAPYVGSFTPTTSGQVYVSARVTDATGKITTTFQAIAVAAAPATGGGNGGGGTIPTTPAAPTFANFSDTQSGGTVQVVPTSPLPLSMYVYALPSAPTVFLAVPEAGNGVITVGNIDGSVLVKSLAGIYQGVSYNGSDVASSPAFTSYTAPPKTITAIVVSGPNSVNEGASATFSVNATYSDGSTGVVTSNITWSANAPNGVFSPPANNTQGDGYTATITATVGSLSNNKSVTVVDTTQPSGQTVTAYFGSFPSTTPTATQLLAATAAQWDKSARQVTINCQDTWPGFAEPQTQGIRQSIADKNGFDITSDVTRSAITLNGTAYWLYVHQNAQYTSAFVFSIPVPQ